MSFARHHFKKEKAFYLAHAIIILALAVSACPQRIPPGGKPILASPTAPFISEEKSVTLLGRRFLLRVISSDIPPTLDITGDCPIIMFSSSTPPYKIHINGDVVSFGGHTFSLTAKADVFLIDGKPMELAPPGSPITFEILDGKLEGIYR